MMPLERSSVFQVPFLRETSYSAIPADPNWIWIRATARRPVCYPRNMPATAKTPKRDWTRPELLKALSLYCQIPFGQFHAKNRHVIAIAHEIGRTPSSVSLKLTNFASLDPYHAARGVSGMSNASRADRAIWKEFYGRWETLATESSNSLVQEGAEAIEPEEGRPKAPGLNPPATTATRLTNVRLGQAFFRNAVVSAWGGRCALTNISEPALLRASHIRPWASHPDSRLDPTNGLCLNSLHDAAFDRGLIAFSDRFELQLSKRLRKSLPPDIYEDLFASKEGIPLRMPDRFIPSLDSLTYHRSTVFCP